ncbi:MULTISPECIES: hypothetical protein [unclassified Streptomyces]|uniref:hypothetical protein n=1 Tax=unclassified Streptomyces TaxID=2593676 RepID=UPI000BEFB84A|nr:MULTISPECIES: hypothetical protein [unclassified Streptomyces]
MTDAAEPPPELQPHEGRSWKSRIRGSPADWLSVAVAALALVISLLSYQQARNAEKTAREAEQRGGATKVGFWRQDYANPQALHIVNRNPFDIDDVTITFKDGYYLKVGLVPACQGWTLAGYSSPAEEGGTYTAPFPARLDFRDQESPPGRWTIDDQPPHRQEKPPPLPPKKDATAAFRANIIGPYYVGCAS